MRPLSLKAVHKAASTTRLLKPGTPPIDRWWERAACAGMDAEIFFPQITGKGAFNRARKVCAQCWVRRQCLEDALAHNSEHGMFGGTTPRQRRTIKNRRNKLLAQ